MITVSDGSGLWLECPGAGQAKIFGLFRYARPCRNYTIHPGATREITREDANERVGQLDISDVFAVRLRLHENAAAHVHVRYSERLSLRQPSVECYHTGAQL